MSRIRCLKSVRIRSRDAVVAVAMKGASLDDRLHLADMTGRQLGGLVRPQLS